MAGAAIDPDRLDVLRALADPTRNTLYRQLQDSPEPLTTRELASRVDLHPNTVRAHLDQLVAVGLVRADTARHGGRGRPRHRFSALPPTPPPPSTRAEVDRRPGSAPAPAEPAEAAEPAAGLARSLVQVAEEAGVASDVIRRVGRRVGQDRASSTCPPASTAEALRLVVEHEARQGYGPRVEALVAGRWRLSFSTCPFRDLASEAPEVVCSLHAGSVEGTCAATGRLVLESFTPLQGGQDCHAVVADATRDAQRSRRYHATPTKED